MRTLRAVRSPLVVDAAIAIALAAVGILQGFDDRQHDWKPYDATAAILTAPATLPVTFRRRAPVPVLLVYYFFWTIEIALGYNPVINTYGMLVAMYTVAATASWRWVAATFGLGAVIWIVAGPARPAASPAALTLQAPRGAGRALEDRRHGQATGPQQRPAAPTSSSSPGAR